MNAIIILLISVILFTIVLYTIVYFYKKEVENNAKTSSKFLDLLETQRKQTVFQLDPSDDKMNRVIQEAEKDGYTALSQLEIYPSVHGLNGAHAPTLMNKLNSLFDNCEIVGELIRPHYAIRDMVLKMTKTINHKKTNYYVYIEFRAEKADRITPSPNVVWDETSPEIMGRLLQHMKFNQDHYLLVVGAMKVVFPTDSWIKPGLIEEAYNASGYAYVKEETTHEATVYTGVNMKGNIVFVPLKTGRLAQAKQTNLATHYPKVTVEVAERKGEISMNKVYPYIMDILKNKGNVFLEGDPGTGKSFLINRLMVDLSNVGHKVRIIPPSLFEHMDKLMNALSELISDEEEDNELPNIWVVDEADELIKKGDKTPIKSIFMQLMDGPMSILTNSCLLLSFNINRGEVMEAMLRPGRCHMYFQFQGIERNAIPELVKEIQDANPEKFFDNSRLEQILKEKGEATLAEVYGLLSSKDSRVILSEISKEILQHLSEDSDWEEVEEIEEKKQQPPVAKKHSFKRRKR